MNFSRKKIAVLTAVSVGGVGFLGSATVAQARVLDTEQKRCGNATVTAKLERDSNEKEVDIEVYSQRAGERWRMIIKDADGEVLRTVNRQTNREGEFDVWRSIPGSVTDVTVDVRGPRGQTCTLTLSG